MVNEAEITIIIIAGTLVMVSLIMSILMFVVLYNRKLWIKESNHKLEIKDHELQMLRSVIDTQESEREIIATNLHDEVGPLLSTLKLNVSRYKKLLQKGTLTIDNLDKERSFIDSIIDNVRTASHNLSPQFLLKFGITKAIQNHIQSITTTKTEFNSNINGDSIDKQVTINVYRIFLEVINNVLKHDHPSTLTINLHQEKDQLTLTITHNGTGINNTQFHNHIQNANGIGLNSIKSRVLVINGQINYSNNQESQIQLITPIHG